VAESDGAKKPAAILLNGLVPVNGATLHVALTVSTREELHLFISTVIAPAAEKLGFTIQLTELPPQTDGPVSL